MKSGVARRLAFYGAFACAPTAWSPPTLALDPALDVVQYAHTAWRVREGFAKGAIQAIAQTPDGYLWLGTEFGLLRFDGVRAVPWRPPQGQQLPDDDVWSLLASGDGTLWIGTIKGLASWRDGRLTQYPELAGSAVTALLQDRDHAVWVGSLTNQRAGRLCAIRATTVACQGEDSRFGLGLMSLYESRDGTLWAGSKGVWRWKPGSPREIPLPPTEHNGAMAIAQDEQDALLVGVDTGLKRAVGGKLESVHLSSSLQPKRVHHLLRDRDGSLWIGTMEGGIWHMHRGRTDIFAASDGLSGATVSCIFEDREGSIWVGTTEGLDRFRNLAVATFSAAQGLSARLVASVLAARDGSIWLGTLGGLDRWNGQALTAWSGSDRTGARVIPNSLYEDSQGRIWVSQAGGLGTIDDGRLISISGAPADPVHAMAEDAPDSLWISTLHLGFFHVLRMKVVQQIPWSALGHRQDALSMVPDRNGGLWLGFADGGVSRFVEGKIVASYSAADGLAAGMITDLLLDKRGVLWATADGGLSRILSSRIETITRKDGLPCDRTYHILEDDDDAFWLFMACGLVRVDRSELERWLAARNEIAAGSPAPLQTRVFDESDGVMLPASMAGGYGPRVAKSSDGKLWFATLQGVSVIDPRHLPVNQLPPPVHIEQITADRRIYEVLPDVRLPPLIRDLQIDYTALSLVAPQKVQFQYRLDGHDRDWQNPGNRRQAFYADLPPGQYRFRVIASNNTGVWNEQGASLDFVIAPTYWQTNWFRALCAAAFFALLWLAYWLRVSHLAKRFNRTLAARVGERTRIARELHDTLLQSFHGLLLLFQAALEQLPPDAAQAKKTLERAIDRAAQAITEGRDAVQGLRASVVERNDLATALKTFADGLATDGGGTDAVGANVMVEGASRALHPILRDEIYRIGCEALRNACRHAAARQIEVELRYDERQLRLRVRDDGKGIDPAYLTDEGRPGHFGLHGMRERAQLIGGKLTVWSGLGAGTEVELIIPAARAYAVATSEGGTWLTRRFAGKTTADES